MKYFKYLLILFCLLISKISFSQSISSYQNVHVYFQYIQSSAIIYPDSLIKQGNLNNVIDLERSDEENQLQIEYKNLEIVFEDFDEAIQERGVSYLNDSTFTQGELYQRGYQDGRIYYKNTGTFWGAFGVGFLAPFTYGIPSLVVGGTMAAIPPNERNLRYHDRRMLYNYSSNIIKESNELFNNINYSRGYKKGAHNKKLGSVAGGFGAGLGTSLVIISIVYIALFSAYQ